MDKKNEIEHSELVEIDQFVGKITIVGNSLCVIIPKKNIDFAGLKEHDILKVWFKKKVE